MGCSLRDEKYANIAFNEASNSNMTMKHGCIAVRSGRIIAKGHNSTRTYSNDGYINMCCSCHAEIDVLRKCHKMKIYDKINLYIIRRTSQGEYSHSAPCIACYETMKLFKIKNIIFSDISGELVKTKFNDYKALHDSSGLKAIRGNRVKMFS